MRISLNIQKNAQVTGSTWIAVNGDKDIVDRVRVAIEKEFAKDKDIKVA